MGWLANHWFEVSVIALLGAITMVLVLALIESGARWDSHMPDIVQKVTCANEEPLYRITASVERVEDLVQDIERALRTGQQPGGGRGVDGTVGAQGVSLSVVPPAPQTRQQR